MSSLVEDHWVVIVVIIGFLGTLLVFYMVTDSGPKGNFSFGPSTHVVVTGGSSGIGFATAELFRRRNCNVTIIARNLQKLCEAKDEIDSKTKGSAGELHFVSADVSDKEKVAEAVRTSCEKFGNRVDVLVCSAGVSRPGRMEEIPVEMYERMISVNYLGSLYAVLAVAPYMKRQESGRLMLVSSLAGLAGMIGFAGYSPSKFAVRGLAESLQMELRPFNIFTTLINPPDVDTPMLKEEMSYKPEECKIISEGGGLFSPEDIASDIVSAVKSWKFMVNTGFDGYLLGLSSSGISCPSPSTINTFIEIFFSGFLRFVGLLYLYYWNNICTKHYKGHLRQKNVSNDSNQCENVENVIVTKH